MIPQAPCKDCTARTVGCHGSCKAYNDYRDTMKDFHKQAKLDNAIKGYQYRAITYSLAQKEKRRGWKRKDGERF